MSKPRIGLQLWTVRELLSADFAGTLAAVSAAGYDAVEFAGNYGQKPPTDLAALLSELNLKCCGLHSNIAELRDPSSNTYAYAKALGAKHLTVSMPSAVQKDCLGAIKDIVQAAEAVKQQGYVFTYHNHAAEFDRVNGEYALDLIFERTSPDTVKAELDTYWIRKGGADPVAFIRKYSDRMPQLHLKDMDGEDESFAEVGEGCLDMKGILAAASQSAVEWLIVEQDKCKRDPLESIRISIDNLKGLLAS
jgi:sugar phosphate isomerase/epimerase